MNFSDIYNKIKAIDEGTHQADTTMKHVKNPTQGEKDAAKDIKPGIAGYRDRIDMLKSAEKDGRIKDESMGEVEECGDMPMGGAISSPGQSDSVTMSVSMNGSGDGGIRDLMNILKGIENVGEPSADHDHDDVLFGAELEPEMEEFANSMAGASEQETMPISTITDIGSTAGLGDHEAEKVNGGGNPYNQVSEELVGKLQELYNQFKV